MTEVSKFQDRETKPFQASKLDQPIRDPMPFLLPLRYGQSAEIVAITAARVIRAIDRPISRMLASAAAHKSSIAMRMARQPT